MKSKVAKYYVYHLIDPRTGKVFYVGKGSGDRIKHHERDARKLRFANTEKETVILEIWESGHNVVRSFVAWFHDEADAYQFEKTEIFRIGHENLTNAIGGVTAEIDRAICKAKWFISDMQSKAAILTGSSRDMAISLAAEMQENLDMAMRQKAKA